MAPVAIGHPDHRDAFRYEIRPFDTGGLEAFVCRYICTSKPLNNTPFLLYKKRTICTLLIYLSLTVLRTRLVYDVLYIQVHVLFMDNIHLLKINQYI